MTMTAISTARPAVVSAAIEVGGYARFRIGEVSVAIRSELRDALDDVKHLYRDCYCDDVDVNDDETVVIEVVRTRPIPLMPRRYTISVNGEALFEHKVANEVLPYIEWAMNWRVMRVYHRYLQLHSGTLARDGRGLMLIASSGSGKSTTAAGLLARGWKFFSDEFALIDPATLKLHAFPKALCVKAGAFDVVRGLGLPLYENRHYVKAFKGRVAYISMADIAPDVVASPCPVNYIIFPQYTGTSQPKITKISRSKAAIELARQAFNRGAYNQQAFDIFATVVDNADCYQLEAGDINTTCRLIDSVID